MLTTDELERRLVLQRELTILANQLIYECREIGRIPQTSVVIDNSMYESRSLKFSGSEGFTFGGVKIELFGYKDFCLISRSLPKFVDIFREQIAAIKKKNDSTMNDSIHTDILALARGEEFVLKRTSVYR